MAQTRARGELERGVLQVLWHADTPLSARDVQSRIDGQPPAYTTLLTVLDRLHKKGQVIRRGDSPRKLRFEAARTAQEHASAAMHSALDATPDRRAALLRFAGNLGTADLQALRDAIGESGISRVSEGP